MSSLRIVLATVGSRGDVQPMIALAQTLAARGHVPLVAAPPNFEKWVRNVGFEFEPLGLDIQEYLANNGTSLSGNPMKMLPMMNRFFAEQIPQQMARLARICEGADAILAGGLAFCAPSVAEYLGVPVLYVFYSTCMLPSSQHPPIVAPWQGLPAWQNDLLWRANHLLFDAILGKVLNGARAEFGLSKMDSLKDHFTVDTPAVIAVDKELFPPDPLWAERYPYANFIYFDDTGKLDEELDDWLNQGEPPVFVGFGSMSGEGTGRIERMIVEAVSVTKLRCIVGAGWAGLGAVELPPTWRVVRETPHALLFPRTAVVVHHGGSGTTATALRAGIPQVILPLILDQFHHAHRLHIAGISPRPIPMEKITASELASTLIAALALPEAPRKAAAARLGTSDGRAQIAARIETMAAQARELS